MQEKIATTHARRTGIAFILALAGLTLGACTPSPTLTEAEIERGHQLRPPFQVEHTVHRHLVPVSVTNTEIGERQYRDLYNFLIGVGAKYGDRVVLAARRSRLEQRDQVHQFLRRVGVRSDLKLIKDLDAGMEDDGYDQVILVRYDRYTPRQHECGKWGEKVKTNYYTMSYRNFGCATTANAQQQAAYPSSLVEGEMLAFPDGELAAESILRYRSRQVEKIKEESSSEMAGGG